MKKKAMTRKYVEKKLNDLLEIQKNCISDGYMRGMYNGLMCAKSSLLEQPPEYIR